MNFDFLLSHTAHFDKSIGFPSFYLCNPHVFTFCIHLHFKALEIKIFVLFQLVFAKNTILSCFFFVIINLCFLIPAVIKQIFNPTAELVIPTGIPTREAKAEFQSQSVKVEAKISKYSI